MEDKKENSPVWVADRDLRLLVSRTHPPRRKSMQELEKRIEMTKGYKGVGGVIQEKTDSAFELYIISLDNGIRVAAGPSAFTRKEKPE